MPPKREMSLAELVFPRDHQKRMAAVVGVEEGATEEMTEEMKDEAGAAGEEEGAETMMPSYKKYKTVSPSSNERILVAFPLQRVNQQQQQRAVRMLVLHHFHVKANMPLIGLM